MGHPPLPAAVPPDAPAFAPVPAVPPVPAEPTPAAAPAVAPPPPVPIGCIVAPSSLHAHKPARSTTETRAVAFISDSLRWRGAADRSSHARVVRARAVAPSSKISHVVTRRGERSSLTFRSSGVLAQRTATFARCWRGSGVPNRERSWQRRVAFHGARARMRPQAARASSSTWRSRARCGLGGWNRSDVLVVSGDLLRLIHVDEPHRRQGPRSPTARTSCASGSANELASRLHVLGRSKNSGQAGWFCRRTAQPRDPWSPAT
jgi:hypothetical protein